MLLSIIEIIVVILPVLLGIAYLTLAERKVMGSMQRRVGPNHIGQIKNYYTKYILKRFYHKSLTLYYINNKISEAGPRLQMGSSLAGDNILDKEAIQILYQDRVAPVKLFDNNKIIATCYNLLNSEERSYFFEQWKDKGGIYIIQYKFNPYVYYIGRTNKFYTRLKSHIKHKLNDRFHVFAILVGWDKFQFSIIEICPLNVQAKIEKII